jgi:PAS domain S-box-containing protein
MPREGKGDTPVVEKNRNREKKDGREHGQAGVSRFSEEAFDDRTLLLASIVESSDDAIITKTSKGFITSWNSGAERIYGFTAEEVLGEPISILIPPGHSDEVPGILEGIKRGKSIRHYETVRKRKDGQLINVSVSISPVKDKEGRILGASTIARDITAEVGARSQAEEKLAAASQYARSLIEASLDPLVTISPEGKIMDVNEATVKVTGIPRAKLIGTDFSDYFTEPEKAREGYQQVFQKGFVTDYPLTIRHKDGRLMNVLYNASVYRDVEGNVLGVFAAARDVTAQREAEAKIAEQRAREEERARELERLAELERFQKLTVGRELKMIELKKEIEELRRENDRLRKALPEEKTEG